MGPATFLVKNGKKSYLLYFFKGKFFNELRNLTAESDSTKQKAWDINLVSYERRFF